MVEIIQSKARDDTKPLVTVAMPVYNAGKYLRLAVLSIVKQTFTDWKLLIIDDNSTDNSLDSIADILDSRICVLRDGKNLGLAARLNEAINLASGQYLARMDQDDVSYPERFEYQVRALINEPTLDLVAVRAITIDENNQVTGLFPYALSHETICARPWQGFYMPHPTWMGRVEWFRKYQYAIPGPYFCEDQQLLLRSYRKSQFKTIDKILFGYRTRAKTNWPKLIETRWAILKVQFCHFREARQWYFISLAILIFVGRVAGDLLRLIVRIVFREQPKTITVQISSQWSDVLNNIAAKP